MVLWARIGNSNILIPGNHQIPRVATSRPSAFPWEMPLVLALSVTNYPKCPGRILDRPVKGARNKLLFKLAAMVEAEKKVLLPNSSSNILVMEWTGNHNRSMAGVEVIGRAHRHNLCDPPRWRFGRRGSPVDQCH